MVAARRLNCKFLHVPKGTHSVSMALLQTQEMDRIVQQQVAEQIAVAMEQLQAPPFAGRGWHHTRGANPHRNPTANPNLNPAPHTWANGGKAGTGLEDANAQGRGIHTR